MKLINKFTLCVSFLLFIIAIAGCSRVEQYGNPISDREITKINTIFSNTKNYEGKTVKVEGSIFSECPTGCWLNLKDETNVIYIDLNPSGIAIPQKIGGSITVEGEVVNKSGRTMIIGKGVELR